MSAVDFGEWVAPDLVLTLGGRTYKVSAPSTERAKKIMAAAVRGEVNLKFVDGDIPAEVQAVLDTIEPGDHPALGTVYDQLVHDGVDQFTIDRMGYYATFYWARGPKYADALAKLLWSPIETAAEADAEPAPKG